MSLLKVRVEKEFDPKDVYAATLTEFHITVLDFINSYVEPGPVRRSLLGMVNTEGEIGIPAYAEKVFVKMGWKYAQVSVMLNGNLRRRMKAAHARNVDSVFKNRLVLNNGSKQ